MPTKKIKDLSRPCLSPYHNPPAHMVYLPGVYEHICDVCGHKQIFTVHGVYHKEHLGGGHSWGLIEDPKNYPDIRWNNDIYGEKGFKRFTNRGY